MHDSQLELLKSIIDEHSKNIEYLRNSKYEITNNLIVVTETMKRFNHDLESIVISCTKLSEKIDEFVKKNHEIELQIQEFLVRRAIFSKIIKKSPRFFTSVIVLGSVIYLAIDSKSMHEFLKSIKNILS